MTTATKQDFDLGTTIRIETVLTDSDGNPIDGNSVVLTVKPPTGANVTASVSRTAVGTYHADVVGTMAGQWFYRWTDGSPSSAQEGSFVVRSSKVI